MEQQAFIPTISTGYFYNSEDELVAVFESAISQDISVSQSNLDIEGGPNNKLLYRHYFGRRMEVSVTSATFKPEFIALNVGGSFEEVTDDMKREEEITLDSSGEATLDEVPSAGLLVEIYNSATNSTVSVEPTGSDITYAPWADADVSVSYYTSTTVQQLKMGELAPTTVKAVLVSNIYGPDGNIIQKLQFTVPQLQISGEFDLAFSASSAVESNISGMATFADAYKSYCILNIEEVTDTIAGVSGIYGVFEDTGSNVLEVPSPSTSTDYDTIIYGVRGPLYGNKVVTSDCDFAMSADSDSDITVGATTGVVTVASTAIAGDSAQVDVTYTVDGVDYENTLIIDIVAV